MPNPIESLTKLVGFGVQQGASVLGKAASTVRGLTGLGGGQDQPEEQKPATRADAQRQRTRRAAGQRRASRKPKPIGDVAITRKVETEIFRSPDVEKGKIAVNTAEGVVWLRGEAKNPEQVKQLEALAAAIPEVKRVENLLHLPKTPAPTRTDTPASQRRTRTTKPPGEEREVTRAGTTSESPAAASSSSEPAPVNLDETRSGRPASPLGSGDGETGENG
jgi:BON domain